ncbi:MAG: hypothetical protein LBM95_05875 [Lactobacillales bacterium]|nr:hypothetical protein [Lactobacillales bacterium]
MNQPLYIPFDLFVPEQYMTEDLSIAVLPVQTTNDNPYSSQGDILIAVQFSSETNILSHLTDGSFILLVDVEGSPSEVTSMKLSVHEDIYTFVPTSKIATKPIVKFRENLQELIILGKVIFSFHDFGGLTDMNEKFREILHFPQEGLNL